ncbi:MAG: hypothetical protein RSF67_10080, partial [Clostridia bacterium]
MKILNRYILILIVLVYTVRIGISFYNFNYKYKDSNYKNIVVDILNIDKIEDKKVTYTCKYNNDT